MQDNLNKIKIDANEPVIPDFDNVVGLFNLLLKIDMRVNPDLYNNNKQHDRHNMLTNTQKQNTLA